MRDIRGQLPPLGLRVQPQSPAHVNGDRARVLLFLQAGMSHSEALRAAVAARMEVQCRACSRPTLDAYTRLCPDCRTATYSRYATEGMEVQR